MLLYISIASIILSCVLYFFNWKSNPNTLFLALFFILASSFGMAHYFMLYGHSAFWLAIFYNHFSPFMFLLGPFLLFYVRGTLQNRNNLYKNDWIHFIPTLIAVIGSIPYFLQPFEEKIKIANAILSSSDAVATISVNMFYSAGVSFALRCLFSFAYLLYCIYLVVGLYNKKKQLETTHLWLVVLLFNLLFINTSFLYLALQSAYATTHENIASGQVFYIIAGIGYSFLSFSLILFPKVLYGVPTTSNSIVNPQKKKLKEKVDPREDPFFEMANTILSYIENEKPFLNVECNKNDIAKALNISLTHLNYCFIYLLETKFSTLITRLRVDYAKQLIDSNSNLTIETISQQSGFKKEAKFISSFEKQMGLSLGEYLANRHK
jgi:AraC-like DNA-binding protein